MTTRTRPDPKGVVAGPPVGAHRNAPSGLALARGTGYTVRTWRLALAVAGDVLPPLVVMTLLLGAWWLYIEVDDTPDYLAASPRDVYEELDDRPGFYVNEAWFTLKNALAGLAIGTTIALGLAVLMAHSRVIEKGLFPIAILIKVTPIVAVAPLFAIWWGFGNEPKIAIAALISWFPMLVNGILGFRSIEPAAHDFLRSINASRLQVFLKLRLPSALPYLVAGMRVALPLSIIGSVVAEWFGSAGGLGREIQFASGTLDMPALFASVIVLAILGVALNSLLSAAEGALLSWHESHQL